MAKIHVMTAIVIAGCAGADTNGVSSAPPPIAVATIDPSRAGDAIPAGFLGLSHEWGQAQLLMGDPAIGVNPIYRQLLRNLVSYGGGPLSLRIGGSTTDRTSEPRANTVTPLARLHEDVPDTAFLLSVNLGAKDVELATRQAKAFVDGMPPGSIDAIELGNQADAFSANKYRERGYDFDDYIAEWHAFTANIREAVPNAPGFMGPSNAGFSGVRFVPILPATRFGGPDKFAEFLQREGDSIAIISQHAYTGGGTKCGGRPKPGFLLQPSSALEDPTLAEPYIAVTRAAGKPYRMAEMNSIMCSGEPGVSDAFEAALWTIDVLFEYAKRGVAGVNLHSNNWNTIHGWDTYGAFLFDVPERQYISSNTEAPPPKVSRFSAVYELRAVLPAYYGLWFFARATAHRARLVPVELHAFANVKVWATLDEASDALLVTVINKDRRAGTVRITVPTFSTATLVRLRAPSFHAQREISLGGLTFDGSRDGKPLGEEHTETLRRSPAGSFELAMPPTSAVLLTLVR